MQAPARSDQIKSKGRVAAHGEVLTAAREIDAMLGLVEQETRRIESRFLEPACGDGNFLAAVLSRKLDVVARRYGAVQIEFERNAVTAVSSVYGIDLLKDNVDECRSRLLRVFDEDYYARLFGEKARKGCRRAVCFLLERNIIWGDALTLRTCDIPPEPIVFSEWSPLNGSLIKRRDFKFYSLLAHAGMMELPLFSDTEEAVFIPTPEREFPPVHFLELGHVATE